MTMKNHMQSLGAAFAMTLGVVLAAGSGFAQDAANGSPGRDALRAEGGGIGGGSAIKSGADINGKDPGGDRGGSPNRPGVGDGARTAVSAHTGAGGVDASRTGTAPASALGTTSGSLDVGLNPGAEPIRLEGGFTGLQRRANRKTLIANVPKIPGRPPAAIGISAPPGGVNGPTARNAVSVIVLGGPSSGRNAPDFRTYVGISASGVGTPNTGGVGVGATKANAGAMDWRRPSLPSNAVTGAMPHAPVINGTTVSHIASGPGYLGGPAKDRSGINGTAIRPKH
jgi:hypothetical protein